MEKSIFSRLDPQQERALTLMKEGKNVFLTGRAGCGKSFVIDEFQKQCTKNIACLAPTGMAALNINGSTIHSFLGLPIGVITPETQINIDTERILMLKNIEVIIIDEVSMVRSDVFCAIDRVLREANQTNVPFAGKQLIIVGDFCQLSPVVTDWKIREYLNEVFGGVFAFTTDSWKSGMFVCVFLEHAHRQNDKNFLKIAEAIRTGNTIYYWDEVVPAKEYLEIEHSDSYISVLNRLSIHNKQHKLGESVNLCCTRYDAEQINLEAYKQLPGQETVTHAMVAGYFPMDAFPTNPTLRLKVGEKVMLLSNHRRNPAFCNGLTGTVLACSSGPHPQAIIVSSSGQMIPVDPVTWSHYKYELETDIYGKKHLIQKVTGQFTQLPLIPAYAVTIHKIQGQTLNAVHLIRGKNGFFCAGQLYTALTRARGLGGITLEQPLEKSDCICDPQVLDFYRRIEPHHYYNEDGIWI